MVDAGQILGPRVYATGPGVFCDIRHRDRDSAFRFMKRYSEAYDTNTIKQYMAGNRGRQWMIEAAKSTASRRPSKAGST